jgi:hypothetical protein
MLHKTSAPRSISVNDDTTIINQSYPKAGTQGPTGTTLTYMYTVRCRCVQIHLRACHDNLPLSMIRSFYENKVKSFYFSLQTSVSLNENLQIFEVFLKHFS